VGSDDGSPKYRLFCAQGQSRQGYMTSLVIFHEYKIRQMKRYCSVLALDLWELP